jgi:DNA replication protein DnaC
MRTLADVLSNPARVRMAAPESLPGTAEERDGDCPLCGGGGFYRRPRPLDDPAFGRVEPCDCVLGEALDVKRTRLERISNLGNLARFTFGTMDESRGGAWLAEAIETARRFAVSPQGWLVVHGPSGSGKTHLAAAVANARIGSGEPALAWVVPDLLDALRASYRPEEGEPGYQELFELVKGHPFLVLDDIDALPWKDGTPWAREKLFQVINHRSSAALPTVFTVSSKFSALDERLASRFRDGGLSTVVTLAGPAGATYEQVGGMTRERLAEFPLGQFVRGHAACRPEERASLDAAWRVATTWADHPQEWLLFAGGHGCGKTHLAAGIASRCLAEGRGVFFAIVPDLLDHLRAAYAPNAEATFDETFEHVRLADILVLDDLGAHQSSPWAEEKLFQIVNYRWLNKLRTIITTNLTREELIEGHPRLAARILDVHNTTFVGINAPHYTMGHMATRPVARPPARRGARG